MSGALRCAVCAGQSTAAAARLAERQPCRGGKRVAPVGTLPAERSTAWPNTTALCALFAPGAPSGSCAGRAWAARPSRASATPTPTCPAWGTATNAVRTHTLCCRRRACAWTSRHSRCRWVGLPRRLTQHMCMCVRVHTRWECGHWAVDGCITSRQPAGTVATLVAINAGSCSRCWRAPACRTPGAYPSSPKNEEQHPSAP